MRRILLLWSRVNFSLWSFGDHIEALTTIGEAGGGFAHIIRTGGDFRTIHIISCFGAFAVSFRFLNHTPSPPPKKKKMPADQFDNQLTVHLLFHLQSSLSLKITNMSVHVLSYKLYFAVQLFPTSVRKNDRTYLNTM